jgi:hypothetical protein
VGVLGAAVRIVLYSNACPVVGAPPAPYHSLPSPRRRNNGMTVITWRPAYQPLVTTGAGDFPIGYLPIGALPIGIFPIGALPMTGCGGGGWGCGRSAATVALRSPSDIALTIRNFIPPPCSMTSEFRIG